MILGMAQKTAGTREEKCTIGKERSESTDSHNTKRNQIDHGDISENQENELHPYKNLHTLTADCGDYPFFSFRLYLKSFHNKGQTDPLGSMVIRRNAAITYC